MSHRTGQVGRIAAVLLDPERTAAPLDAITPPLHLAMNMRAGG
jgi:hypothetical protein